MKKLSLVVPVYNEEEVILQFIKETKDVLGKLNIEYEYVFVDDGSQDQTVELIRNEGVSDKRIKLIALAYNHGKAYSITTAISYATGDYLLYMDPDLQDPPIEIPRFLEEIEKGYDLVWGIRKEKMDSFLNRKMSDVFWWLLNRFTGLNIPRGIAVMRIFNKSFASQFLKYNETNRFIEGIFIHISKKWTTMEISQRERFAGTTKFNFKRKIQLAFDAIFDYSELPLKISARLGMFFVGFGIVILITLLILKLFYVDFQAGWPSIIASILVFFGLQLFFLGIIALYIGRIYKEVKRRPLFAIKELINIPE